MKFITRRNAALFGWTMMIYDSESFGVHRCSTHQRSSCTVVWKTTAATTNQATDIGSISVASKPIRTTARYYAAAALLPRKPNDSCASVAAAFAVDRLESSLVSTTLSIRDRAFARLLVTTVERRWGQIEHILILCQKKKTQSQRQQRMSDQWVHSVLRIGVAQLLFLQTPVHAAVKESIDVLRQSPPGLGNSSSRHGTNTIKISEAQIRYANAILRRIAREAAYLMSSTNVTANAAPWLVEEWNQSWGTNATEHILEAAMVESPRCLTINPLVVQSLIDSEYNNDTSTEHERPSPQQYVADLFEHAEILPQGSIRVTKPPSGPISTWPLYQAGAWWCQDPAATIPVLALASCCTTLGRNHQWEIVDLCAAPGGKTAQLCHSFSKVRAIEISTRRADRLAQNRERLGLEWDIIIADACEWCPSKLVDAVLVDVPCTATGTASKRPDVLRRSPNLASLLHVQQALAQHAADHIVKVGGILVYATCSLLQQESEDQVWKLLHRTEEGSAQLETLPFCAGEIPGFDVGIDSNGWMRIIPGALPGSLGQCDGFFVARLRRIA